MKKPSYGAVLFSVYAVGITILPVIFLPFFFGMNSAFWLLTGDAYLYLGIAESSTPEYFSFDGENPTNGFHPLWQSCIWLINQLIGDAPLILMNITAWGAVLLTACGAILIGTASHRVTGSWLLATLATPGVYYLMVGQGLGNLAVWNFFSGMEAGLVFALTGIILRILVEIRSNENRLTFWLGLGCVLAILTLARLDEVFVAPAIGLVWLLWDPQEFRRRIWSVVLLGLPLLITLCAYWAYNAFHVGPLMPVSGAAKGEGALLSNIYVTAVTFLAPIFDLRVWLSDYDANRQQLADAAFRVAQVVFPAVAAAGMIWALRTFFRSAAWAAPLSGMCLAIIIKAGYNFAGVNYWHQATWYYAFACGVLSFSTAVICAPAMQHLRHRAFALYLMLPGLMIMVSLLQASQNYVAEIENPAPEQRRKFWESGPRIARELKEITPQPKLLEFGDGLINFTLDIPVRHGFVFAGDPDSLAALKESRLLQASHADGYHFLASYEYLRWPAATNQRTSEEIKRFLLTSPLDRRIKSELGLFEFKIVYIYDDLGIPIIYFSPSQ